MIKVRINEVNYEVPPNLTILAASRFIGVEIPTLCYIPGLEAIGGCRLCVVEVTGARSLVTACSTPVTENMEIFTNSSRVRECRRTTLDLLLSNHDKNCFSCSKYGMCEFRTLCAEYGLEETSYPADEPLKPLDTSNRFFVRDPNKCILCEKCVRVCKEWQGHGAIWLSSRGYKTEVTPAFKVSAQDSECVSCGTCLTVCPTGSIYPKELHLGSDMSFEKIETVCPYCGVGCKLNLHVKSNKVISVSPANGPANHNLLCVKGRFAYNFINHKDRLKTPFIRKRGKLIPATWDEALDKIKKAYIKIDTEYKKKLFISENCAEKISEFNNQSNSIDNKYKNNVNNDLANNINNSFKNNINGDVDNKLANYKNILNIDTLKDGSPFAGLSSAKCTNEENYLFQKMMRSVFKTNHVDHCARLCHAPTVAGLAMSFGSGAMTNSISEISDMDVIFILGSNTTETHPVIASKMRQAKQKGAIIIVAEPRRIDLCREADIFLQIEPGSNVALLNGLMKAVLEEGLEDKSFITDRTEGFKELTEMLETITVEACADICRVSADDIRAAARTFAKGDKAGVFYAMGVTQHSSGTEGVLSVANFAMLCGKIGKSGCGVNPLRGQNNVQGASDMGAVPTDLPGYQKVAVDSNIQKFEEAWNTKLPKFKGKTVTEIMDEILLEEIRFLFIMGENPMVSDPDLTHAEEALRNTEFLVVADIFMTETAALADVVLPAASFAEKEGTFTNTERRVQLLNKAISSPGESKEDREIIQEIVNAIGGNWNYSSSSQIMDEIASLVPIYGGISYDRLKGANKNYGLQWPCPSLNHSGTKILHTSSFTRGKGKFIPCVYKSPAETSSVEYPFILTTGRILYQYHTRTMTSKSEGIEEIAGKNFVEMNPSTATKYNISQGEMISIFSERGEIEVNVRITSKVKEHILFMPFHYAESAANVLTGANLDPISKIPEYKVSAVGIRKIN